MRVLAGGKRVEIVVEGLDQSGGLRDDIDVGRRKIPDAGVFEPDGFAAVERKDDVGTDLLHGGGDIGKRVETGAVKLQNVAAGTGLEIGNDIVAVAHRDDKGVAAGSASEHVISLAAIDHVVTGIADNNIVEIVAGSGRRNGIRQNQVFDIGRIYEAVAI